MARHRIIAAFFFLGSAVAAGFAVIVPTHDSARDVCLDRLEHDFGAVRQAETLAAPFQVNNKSKRAIQIVDVLSSCDCATAKAVGMSIAPGASGMVAFEWRVGASRGRTRRTVTLVYAREGEDGLFGIDVRLHALVEPDFEFTPKTLSFDIAATIPQARTIEFRCAKLDGFRILEACSTRRGMQAAIIANNTGIASWTVVLTLTEPFTEEPPPGGAQLIVVTNSPREPRVLIPVSFGGDGNLRDSNNGR